MAKTETFECSLITPERSVLTCEATFVAFPAHDGEMGALRHRAPLICKLGIGPLRIETPDRKHTFLIDEGFAQVLSNRLTILTEQATKSDDVEAESAHRAMVQAHEMKITDEASLAARQKAIQRAQAQIKLAQAEA